jgi:hypothetical protein
MIPLLGYFLLAATVQLMSLLRQVPYTHGMSNSLMVLLLTNVPDPLHLKLWSWVSLSFVDCFPSLVNGVLVLDIHWGKEQIWDELGFPQGEGDAVPVLDILLD